MAGKLILCGTPIGNLEDMSPRAVRTLREADVLACEDARRSRKLLSHFGIRPQEIFVYNDGNERRQAPRLLERIQRGQTVVLVSDAGMPGLSDPGYRLVKACADASVEIEVVPGPSAVVSALAVSGLPAGRFVFEGFLPRRRNERRNRIAELAGEQRTLVVYESPHRIEECVADLAEILGERRAALARELTKLYEEVLRGTLRELQDQIRQTPVRGEIVLVVEGAVGAHKREPSGAELAEQARELMAGGMDRREALAQVAKTAGVAKRKVFDALVERPTD